MKDGIAGGISGTIGGAIAAVVVIFSQPQVAIDGSALSEVPTAAQVETQALADKVRADLQCPSVQMRIGAGPDNCFADDPDNPGQQIKIDTRCCDPAGEVSREG